MAGRAWNGSQQGVCGGELLHTANQLERTML